MRRTSNGRQSWSCYRCDSILVFGMLLLVAVRSIHVHATLAFTHHWDARSTWLQHDSLLNANAHATLLLQRRQRAQDRTCRVRASDATRGNSGTRLWDSSDANAGRSNLVASSDVVKTQLLSAFTNLGVSDQYDAVLTGLCAKILDAPKARVGVDEEDNEPTESPVTLTDCLDLLQEMNSQRIAASPRSLMALVDSTVKTQDASVMADVLSQCIRNTNGIRQYGTQQTEVIAFPSSYTTRVSCPSGKKTIVERLESLPNVPVDDRVSEIASAGAFLSAVGSCEVTNIVTADDSLIHLTASAVLTLLVTVTAVDNGYDLLQTASNFVLSQVGKNAKPAENGNNVGATIASTVSDWKLPNKDTLPLGLGTGQITGSVVRGFTRLVTVDPEREAECEAAALYTAFVLGLPCFAFRPNALEASVLVVESKDADSTVDNLLSPSGILRMLVWLMAAPAMESMTHAQLIMSDPREAQGFLQRLEDYYQNNDQVDLFWMDNDIKAKTGDSNTVRDDLLKWAYTEADLLLRANRNVVSELSVRLSSGAATIGDCVAVIEQW